MKGELIHGNQKVDEVIWFSTSFECIGIVISTDQVTREKKAYLGKVQGLDMDIDIRWIIDFGQKFDLKQLINQLERHLPENQNGRTI